MNHDEANALIKQANLMRAGLLTVDARVIKDARRAQEELDEEQKRLLADRVRRVAEVRARSVIAAAQERARKEVAETEAQLARFKPRR